MLRYLFLAEKPSLMRDVQACYKNHITEVQQAVGEIDFIALSGHVCTNYEPDDYEEWHVKWGTIDYPMIPSNWKIKPIKDEGKIKTLAQIKNVARGYDGLIVGTDSDVEGYGIYYMVEHYLGLSDMHALRFMEHSLTDSEILKSLLSMTDYHHDPVHVRYTNSYLLRSRADWLYGMNATRMMSDKMGTLMAVGRVKAPTIKLVYDNSKAIDDFHEKIYYQIKANYGSFEGILNEDDNPVQFNDQSDAKCEADKIPLSGYVRDVNKQNVSTHAPKLYDLTSLQAEAGQKYGYSPIQTLEIVQALYERHKIISYPRTQCRFVSTEKAKEFRGMIDRMRVFPELVPYIDSIQDDVFDKILKDKQVVNDKEVSKESHDALLPTDKKADPSVLTQDEKNICLMIYKRLLSQFLPKLVEEKAKVTIDHNGFIFIANGKRVLHQGWRVLYSDLKDIVLPDLNPGDSIKAEEIVPLEKKTTPPKRLTQATLISAMKNIANLITDKELKASLADSQGIGTSATRAKIIQDIINRGYVIEKRGALYITSLGKAYIENLNSINIISPTFAAIIDTDIKKIQRGESEYDTVYKGVVDDLYKMCGQIRNLKRKEVMTQYICPDCGGYLADRKYAYECINENCNHRDRNGERKPFKIAKNIAGKYVDEVMMKDLMTKGKTAKYTFTKKDGTKFKARLAIINKEVVFDFSSDVKCPVCGEYVNANRAGYFCNCGFKFFNPFINRKFKENEVVKLFDNGVLMGLDGFVSKAGKEFSANVRVNKEEKKVDLFFDN